MEGEMPRASAWIFAAALSAWAIAAAAQAPRGDPRLEPYSRPQVLADVGGGRAIHVVCMGEGSPTVVLTAGAGNWAETWRGVQPELARRTRVCAWDRPGFGFSSPSGARQDVGATMRDLERALRAANVRGPYVLVGHALGAYESLLFADRHPRDVAGMVLDDPRFPVHVA